jgi:hypothetical protein
MDGFELLLNYAKRFLILYSNLELVQEGASSYQAISIAQWNRNFID